MGGKLLSRLTRFAHAAFGLVAALAAAALWGWTSGLDWLRHLGADFAPMSAASAIALMLLAASFLAAERRRTRASYAASFLAAAIALGALAENALALRTGIGISVVAAATLLLLALVTPLPRSARLFGVSVHGAAATVAGAIAFFALLGLSLRVLRFDVAAPLLGFSAPGALATMFAALGLAAARPTSWLLETLIGRRTGAVVTRWLLPAAFVVPLAVGWTRLFAEREGLFGEAV
ncbi:MAG: conserved hypothetical two-component hybrid sensor and regulator, partial [Burkholderiales bacterium]|nr:conserved hypothetical two-component hybrid sensor and regulator [Burkholderiales bacterium]